MRHGIGLEGSSLRKRGHGTLTEQRDARDGVKQSAPWRYCVKSQGKNTSSKKGRTRHIFLEGRETAISSRLRGNFSKIIGVLASSRAGRSVLRPAWNRGILFLRAKDEMEQCVHDRGDDHLLWLALCASAGPRLSSPGRCARR